VFCELVMRDSEHVTAWSRSMHCDTVTWLRGVHCHLALCTRMSWLRSHWSDDFITWLEPMLNNRAMLNNGRVLRSRRYTRGERPRPSLGQVLLRCRRFTWCQRSQPDPRRAMIALGLATGLSCLVQVVSRRALPRSAD
jgi:hypothetical protein